MCYTKRKYFFKKESDIKTFSNIQSLERIHHQQPHTTRNVKGCVLSRIKMTPNANMDLCKEMKTTENDAFLGKYMFFDIT